MAFIHALNCERTVGCPKSARVFKIPNTTVNTPPSCKHMPVESDKRRFCLAECAYASDRYANPRDCPPVVAIDRYT